MLSGGVADCCPLLACLNFMQGLPDTLLALLHSASTASALQKMTFCCSCLLQCSCILCCAGLHGFRK